ncbi:hypothetical protein IMZ48_46140 [Candidatus Bathyarchaeota archaeon]|nr:hypothetical protein [Candidatus Bathyarchaeota archaeon]
MSSNRLARGTKETAAFGGFWASRDVIGGAVGSLCCCWWCEWPAGITGLPHVPVPEGAPGRGRGSDAGSGWLRVELPMPGARREQGRNSRLQRCRVSRRALAANDEPSLQVLSIASHHLPCIQTGPTGNSAPRGNTMAGWIYYALFTVSITPRASAFTAQRAPVTPDSRHVKNPPPALGWKEAYYKGKAPVDEALFRQRANTPFS